MSDRVILAAQNLTKEFKGFFAVEGVNLKVRRGQIHALIGPNGAGKNHLLQPADKIPAANAWNDHLQG